MAEIGAEWGNKNAPDVVSAALELIPNNALREARPTTFAVAFVENEFIIDFTKYYKNGYRLIYK